MSTAQTGKSFHYFYSPFTKYQMTAVLKDGRKVIVHFVESRFMTNDQDLVEAMRANPRFSIDFNETTRLVPQVPVSVAVSTEAGLPVDLDIQNEAVRRAAELEGAGAPKSESGAVDLELTRSQEMRRAIEFNKPGDPIPGKHNDVERATIGTARVIGAARVVEPA